MTPGHAPLLLPSAAEAEAAPLAAAASVGVSSIGIEDDDAITSTADDDKKSNKKVMDAVVVAAIVLR